MISTHCVGRPATVRSKRLTLPGTRAASRLRYAVTSSGAMKSVASTSFRPRASLSGMPSRPGPRLQAGRSPLGVRHSTVSAGLTVYSADVLR
jgi:hypothetical protein